MSIVWPYCDITKPVWSPTSLPYYGSFCNITNISVILWVFLRHHQHLCRIMGLFATSQTSLSYYGSFCDITNISVILLSKTFFAVVWPFLRHHKHLCDTMNVSVVLRVFVQHQKHLCVTQNGMYLCRSLCTLHVLACLHTPNTAFRHLRPNSARFSYATEGALFISAQLSAPSERFGY